MKTKITYSLLAAAAACSLANAQTTAYTTPVGYVNLTIPASSDSTITPSLERSPLLKTSTTGVSGNVVSAAGLTAGAFVAPQCYLQVVTCAATPGLVGKRFAIDSNTTGTITVDGGASTLQAQGFANGDTFKVIPYWTLATLFPAGASVGSTSDVFTIDSFLYVVDNGSYGVNKASSASYFYCSGDEGNGVAAGWYDANDPFGASADDLVIDPTIMYMIRNGSAVANTLTVTGQVPDVKSLALVPVSTELNDVNLAVALPTDVSLQNSGLQSVVQGTSDVFTIDEFVYVYDDEGAGQNKAASATYFYCSGDEGNGVSAGWYDANDPFGAPVTDAVLKAGRCITIRKSSYASNDILDWSLALPYSIN
jgi:uncharacterized protein (TIGR02597 family)